jgi:Sulfatase
VTGQGGQGAQPGAGRWRRELQALLELVALTGIVFLQPTLDVLSKNAGIFVVHGTSPAEIVAFVALAALGPALVLWALGAVIGLLRPSARDLVQQVTLAALTGLLVDVLLFRNTDLSPVVAAAIAVVVGCAALFVLHRTDVVRRWLRVLAIAVPAFAALFLAFSPVTTAVFDDGTTSAADVHIRRDPRVVMLVFDEFPEGSLLDGKGRIDSELFPHFAELAGDASWYRNTSAVAGYTQVAVPAVLTGNYPAEPDPVVTSATFPHSIFSLLDGAYELNVHESATRICPKDSCGSGGATDVSSRSGVRGLVDEAWTAWRRFAWPDRNKGAIDFAGGSDPSEADALRSGREFVRSLQPGTNARLDFLHVLMPHQPWHYLPTGQDYEQQGPAAGAPFYTWSTEYAARSARERHLLQLQAVDRLLGQVIDRLRSFGAYDRSLLVVTADHGVSFHAGASIRGASAPGYQDVAWTPLFVKAPGQSKGAVDDEPAQSIDVLPTIADHLGIELPWKVDGRSVLGPRRAEGPRPFYKWNLNQLPTPPGKDFLQLDGRAGFARMLESRASSVGGDPELRLYRDGPYGKLVGTAAGPRIVGKATTKAHIDGLDRYAALDLDAPKAPWAYLSGSIDGPLGVPLAIAVDGKVVAFSETAGSTDGPVFWAMLPPPLLRDGRNDVELYVVRGDADDPTFEPVALE